MGRMKFCGGGQGMGSRPRKRTEGMGLLRRQRLEARWAPTGAAGRLRHGGLGVPGTGCGRPATRPKPLLLRDRRVRGPAPAAAAQTACGSRLEAVCGRLLPPLPGDAAFPWRRGRSPHVLQRVACSCVCVSAAVRHMRDVGVRRQRESVGETEERGWRGARLGDKVTATGAGAVRAPTAAEQTGCRDVA